MKNTIFKLDRSNVIIHEEAVKLVPEFTKLKTEQLLFIILFCDYNSPIKQFPVNERKDRAILMAFEKTKDKFEETELLKKCIEYYNTLQYDPLQEQIRILKNKHAFFLKKVNDSEDSNEISIAMKTVKTLSDEMRKAEIELESVSDLALIKGGGTNSFLKKWQMNMRRKREQEQN